MMPLFFHINDLSLKFRGAFFISDKFDAGINEKHQGDRPEYPFEELSHGKHIDAKIDLHRTESRIDEKP